MAKKICVGIGQFLYQSLESPLHWEKSVRIIPSKSDPVIRGPVSMSQLPAQEQLYWDYITIQNKFGVAVGHEILKKEDKAGNDRDSIAHVFITFDGGASWEKNHLKFINWIKVKLKQILVPRFPVERFEGLVVTDSGNIGISWDDPWLYDNPRAHLICSSDQGMSWRYNCVGNGWIFQNFRSEFLTYKKAQRLATSKDNGKNWEEFSFEIVWPKEYQGKKVNLLRHIVYVSNEVAYALVVHWPKDHYGTPNVGLLRTENGGKIWEHLQIFPGPTNADINERHVLTLTVEAN
jgi:hypothetical protein